MLKFFRTYKSGRVWLMLTLGFSSGLPILLVSGTLATWLRDIGLSLELVGLIALVTIPYNLKFMWAPLMDRLHPKFLGRRRGWMLITQLAVAAGIFALGQVDPRESMIPVALVGLLLSFWGASQDIVLDAYRTDILPPEERSGGAGTFVSGYRVGMILAGALALIMADHIPWSSVYTIMAVAMGVGIIATFKAPEPDVAPSSASLERAFVDPFVDFFTRRGWLLILIVIMLYKLGDAVGAHLRQPFLLDVGYTKTQIGAINKALGPTCAIVGGLIGGGLVATMGLKRSLIYFGLMQAAANGFYIIIAEAAVSYPSIDVLVATGGMYEPAGPSISLLTGTIFIDELVGGFSTAAWVVFLMSLCNKRFSATQYALFTSASSIVGKLLGATSGYLQGYVMWGGFFLTTIVLAVPAIVILLILPSEVTANQAGTWDTEDDPDTSGDDSSPAPARSS